MCTVTWLRSAGACDIFFNRDERRTRQPARPPRIKEHNGVRLVAPEDGDFGGAWAGANEFGLALGLLNHYQGQPPPPQIPARSRGLLVLSLLDCRDAHEVNRRLSAGPLLAYPPFLLVAFDSAGDTQLHTWDGRSRTTRLLRDEDIPLSTSSFAPEQVVPQRILCLTRLKSERGPLDASLLEAYHKSRDERGGAYSVCMDRDDARTVSFSHIRVDPDAIQFTYQPRSPDGTFSDPVCVILPRST